MMLEFRIPANFMVADCRNFKFQPIARLRIDEFPNSGFLQARGSKEFGIPAIYKVPEGRIAVFRYWMGYYTFANE